MRLTPRHLSRQDTQVIALFLATALGYGLLSANVPLFEPDEGRYAEIPREMLASGDFITPHLGGVVYLEKPPLYYWLNALSLSVLGHSTIAVRFWSLTFGVLGAGLAMILGRRMFEPAVGRRAVVVLLTSPLYFALLGINIIDMTLTFLMSLTLCFFWFAHSSGRANHLCWYGAFAAAALSVLTKGLIGLLLPAAIIGGYLALSRQLRTLRSVPFFKGTLLFLSLALPWHVLIARQTPGFLWFYFVQEHFLRYLTGTHARTQPLWFFLPVLVLGMLPWIGYLPRASFERTEQRARLFLLVWCGVIVGFFSLSNSKLVPYVLPATIPLALLLARGTTAPQKQLSISLAAAHVGLLVLAGALLMAGAGLIEFGVENAADPGAALFAAAALLMGAWNLYVTGREGATQNITRLSAAAACLCLSVLLASNQVAEYRTSRGVASCIESFARPRAAIYAYDVIPQSLPFYLNRVVGIVGYVGEIEYGVRRLSHAERVRSFPTAEEFLPRWASRRRTYLVVEHKNSNKARQQGLTGRRVCEHGRYYVLTNLR